MGSISRFLSRDPPIEAIKNAEKEEPSVLSIDDEAAEEVFSTLSSVTAREVLSTLYDQPKTASEIADTVDTSLQNVNYHLNNLTACDLIQVADTWYSDQGREMKVYSPTNEALILFASDDLQQPSLLDTVKELVGVVAAFGIISVLVDYLVRELATSGSAPLDGGVGGVEPTVFPFSPGILFFVGSLFALLLVAVWRYSHRESRSFHR
jgi:DNA-binding transcriptional ArsR family regulator